MLWIKIRKSDLSFTEGSWTLSNAKLKVVGSFREDSSYPNTKRNAVIRNGYLYVLGYDDTSVYKINLANSTDVTEISLGFTSAGSSICGSGSCEARLLMINDIIIGYDFMIDANDNVIATFGGTRMDLLDAQIFGEAGVLRTAIIFFYMSNEGISLTENAAHLGLPIPEKLRLVLKQLHEKSEEEKDGEDDEVQ